MNSPFHVEHFCCVTIDFSLLAFVLKFSHFFPPNLEIEGQTRFKWGHL